MILAIDPSLTGTGYAVITNDGSIATYGWVKTTTNDIYDIRLQKIFNQVYTVAQQYDTSVLAIETQYINFGIRSNSALKVAEVKGIAEGAYLAHMKDLEPAIIEVNPKLLKTFIGLRHNAKRVEAKKASIEWASEKIGVQVKNDNEADAIVIAYFAYYQIQHALS